MKRIRKTPLVSTIRKPGMVVDGQPMLETKVIRRIRLQKPVTVNVAAPSTIASAIARVFGEQIPDLTEKKMVTEKLVEIEVTPLRWLKPDANGNLIPR